MVSADVKHHVYMYSPINQRNGAEYLMREVQMVLSEGRILKQRAHIFDCQYIKTFMLLKGLVRCILLGHGIFKK